MAIFSSTIKNLALNRPTQPYYHFDGVGDGIAISDQASAFTGFNEISVVAWVKWDTSSSEDIIWSNAGAEVGGTLLQTRGTSGIRAIHNVAGNYYYFDNSFILFIKLILFSFGETVGLPKSDLDPGFTCISNKAGFLTSFDKFLSIFSKEILSSARA